MPNKSIDFDINIQLRDAKRSLGRLQKALKGVQKQTKENAKGFGKLTESAGKAKLAVAGLAGAFYAIGRTLKSSASSFSEFSSRMAEVSTLLDVPAEAIQALGSEVRKLSVDIGKPAAESASALYDIVSAGVDVGDSISVLELASKAAIAGVSDTKTAANLGLTTINAYGDSIDSLSSNYDILFNVVKNGVTTFPELAASIGDVLPTAAAAGVGLAEVGAAMATLTKSGIQTPKAVTALRSAILQLNAPTEGAKKGLLELGIEWQGLEGTMRQIADLDLSLADLRKIIPDQEGAKAVLTLANNFTDLKNGIDEMNNSAGATIEAHDKIKKFQQHQVNLLKASIDDLGLSLGALLSKFLLPVAKALTSFINRFQEAGTITKVFYSALAGYVILAPFKKAIGLAVSSLSSLGAALKASVTAINVFHLSFKQLLGGLAASVVAFDIGRMIGDWLLKFDAVRKAGIALAAGLHKAFVRLKGVFTREGEAIREELARIDDIYADMFARVGETVKLTQAQLNALTGNGQTIKPIKVSAKITSAEEVEVATPEAPQVLPTISDAVLSAEFEAFKASLDRQQKELENAYADREITAQQYYARKAKLARQEIDAEIAFRQQSIAALSGDKEAGGEIRTLALEIQTLRERRADVAADIAREASRSEAEYRDALADTRAELEQLRNLPADNRATIAKQYAGLLDQARGMGDTEGINLIERVIDTKDARARLEQLEQQYTTILSRLSDEEERIRADQEKGLLTAEQAWEKITLLQQKAVTQARELVPEIERVGEAAGTDVSANIGRMNTELDRLSSTAARARPEVESVQESFSDSLADTFANPAEQGIRSMLNSFNLALKQMAAQALATNLTKKLFSSDGVSNTVSRALSSIGGFSVGGYIRGAGTTTSDSILARLSNHEYVIKASAVKYWGRSLFDDLNAFRLPAFADGGPVGAANTPQVNNTNSVSIMNLVDRKLFDDYLASADGQKTLVNIIGRNRRSIGQVL